MEQWLMESFTGPAVEVSPKSEEYDVVTRCGSGVVVAVVQQLDAKVSSKLLEMGVTT